MAEKAFLVCVKEATLITYRVRASTAEEALELCKAHDGYHPKIEQIETSDEGREWEEAEVEEEEGRIG